MAAMQSLSMSEVRRRLPELAHSSETFTLTNRGHNVATVRVFAQASFDPVKAKEAAQRIAALAAKVKPSKRNGATAIIRSIRDA